MTDEIPGLYETDGIPLEEKTIHCRYHIPDLPGFYWLVAEYDPDENVAFGYACLNDPQMAEWGYFSIDELASVGAVLDEDWEPCPYHEARQRLGGERP